MYEVSVNTHFSAAHSLKGYLGACANQHGHNWDVEVFIRGESLNEIGILVDFKTLKKSIADVMDELDHTNLNNLKCFAEKNPTSENIAEYLFKVLSESLDVDAYHIDHVSVHETPGTTATFWRN